MSNTVAIAFTSKNRLELTRRTIEPLLQPDKFDLFIFDGSTDHEARDFACSLGVRTCVDVRGGADAAVVAALSTLLADPNHYEHIGLVENDVLLHPDWFGPTMALFERGRAEGLEVGLASPRAYTDRILLQRDGYAVMHNTGFGVAIYTRKAAEILLQNLRTSWTLENRRLFMQLSGRDIGAYWAFRHNEHWLCADWGVDRVLAAHGLASLALVPSPCEMIGQDPPLAEQGLTLATEPVEWLRDDPVGFPRYRDSLRRIREGFWPVLNDPIYRDHDGVQTFFAHQMSLLSPFTSSTYGAWRLRWSQGFGPFAWEAGTPAQGELGPTISFEASGPCQVIVTGGQKGGHVALFDTVSKQEVATDLLPENPRAGATLLVAPDDVSYRQLILTAHTPGVVFYGVRLRHRQPVDLTHRFTHSVLPPVD